MGVQRISWSPHDGEPVFLGWDSWGHVTSIGGSEQGEAAKPSDLLALSLAACTAYDVIVILRKQRQDLRSVDVEISSEQDPRPPWTFRRIAMHFVLTGEVDATKARNAIDLSEEKYCAVAATIRPVVDLVSTLEV